MRPKQRVVTLQEYRATELPAGELDEESGMLLWQRYDRGSGVLSLEFPSPRSAGRWRLTPRGWAGFIRANDRLIFSLQPRLPLLDLFGMLQAAHGAPGLRMLPDMVQVRSLPAMYDFLAVALARGVLRLARQGLAGGYRARREPLPFVRGRLIPQPAAAPSLLPTVLCEYDEWTTDVPDNQILAWTLHTIARAGFCGQDALAEVRRASRALAGQATLQPVSAAGCQARSYHRLNMAYQPLHALCGFLQAHSTPSHQEGDWLMPAFLVNMPRLYEQFVAATLRRQLPAGWTLREQEVVRLPGKPDKVHFAIDLVLYDQNGAPRVVLDTKYRQPGRAAAESIAQVVAYARTKECGRAILLYPLALSQPLDISVGDTRVQSFALGVGQAAQEDARALLAALGLAQVQNDSFDGLVDGEVRF